MTSIVPAPVTVDVDGDGDLLAPEAGHEMADPNAHGLYDGEQMMQDPRFKTVMSQMDDSVTGGAFDVDVLEQRKREREERLANDPEARAAEDLRMKEAEKMPDIISYGFCKLVYDFLEALHKRFPKRSMLARTLEFYWKLCERCPAMPFQKFQDLVTNCETVKAELIEKRTQAAKAEGKRYDGSQDGDVFEERTDENEQIIMRELMKNPVFKMAKIYKVWRPELDEDTRVKIWAYVNRLVQVTKLISQFNPKLRNLINAVSMDSLNAVKGKDKSQIDVSSLLEELQTRLLDDQSILDEIIELAQQQL